MVPSGVAAGHPATVAAGIEILEEGGTAADAAVAACLASCVAETVMTGLLAGGHAIYFDGEETWNLDCFVDVPSGEGAPPVELRVPFGEELVHYAVGPGTCAVPGLPRGLGELHRRYGRLPWPTVVGPALRLARAGVVMPPAHAACLAMLGPVFTMQPDGERIYSPAGRLLEAGETLEQPGLATALELLADEGADSVYAGSIAEAAHRRRGDPRDGCRPGALRGALGGAGRGRVARPPRPHARRLVRSAPDARAAAAPARSGRHGARARAARSAGRRRRERAHDKSRHRGRGRRRLRAHVEPRPGTGDFLPGLDAQLNSMLGEVDLVRAPLRPGERMGSMMAPTLVFAGDGVELAIGSAGGTRLRTALVGVAAGILDEGLDPVAAVERPRFHRAGDVVNAEPGVDERRSTS